MPYQCPHEILKCVFFLFLPLVSTRKKEKKRNSEQMKWKQAEEFVKNIGFTTNVSTVVINKNLEIYAA